MRPDDRFLELDGLLARLHAGDERARDELFPVVYEELRRLAVAHMAKQRVGHTLQPTALVNEAYLRLCRVDSARLTDRRHFYRLAARVMRQVLVDHARAKNSQKRKPSGERVELDAIVAAHEDHGGDLVALDDALAQLAARDPKLAELVELRFFGGCSIDEAAELLEASPRQVRRWWDAARLILQGLLDEGADGA